MTCEAGLRLFKTYHRPEGSIPRILPKPVSVFLAIFAGTIRPLVILATTLLGTVGFSVKAFHEWSKGGDPKPYAVAALLNLSLLTVSFSFFVAAAFCLPFPMTSGLFVAAVSVSIVYHIIKAVKD